MKIFVKAKPKAKDEGVVKIDDAHFIVHVKEAPAEGRANAAIIDLISRYFQVPKSRIQILRGSKGKDKLIEIKEN